MGYKKSYNKGTSILPAELIQQIQEYVDGEYVYIPRLDENRKRWGDNTDIRQTLESRNREIFGRYQKGARVSELAEEYHISTQGIYKILSKYK